MSSYLLGVSAAGSSSATGSLSLLNYPVPQNIQWIFSGVGVLALTFLLSLWQKRNMEQRGGISQRQRGGDNSTNIQIGNIHQGER